MWTTQFHILTTIHNTLTNKEERTKYNRQCRTAKRNLERDRGCAAEPPANGARAGESEAVPPPTAATMHRSASNAASEVNAEPPPPYRARDHPATFAVMQRHQETMARLIDEGKACQDDLDNLFLLFDVYNTLNPRPDGIQEGANWDALDPMMTLDQPVGKRFWRNDYAGYIVGYDYRWRSGGYVVRYEDGDLRHFPKNELDAYCNYFALMQNRAPPPQRAPERVNPSQHARGHENACLPVLIQFPISMPIQCSRQGVLSSLRVCLREIASLNATTVCQLLYRRAPQLACLSTQLNWFCLCALFFQKDQMNGRLCVNLCIFCRNSCTHKNSDPKTSSHQAN
jgi:hypothetical protein